jgi:tyrosine-protein phosphatase SIW14
MMKKYFRAFAALFVFVLGLSAAAADVPAQTAPEAFPNIKIKNFGKMDERYYRGAQPLPDDYQSLKDLGVKTVIDLRNDPTDYEKSSVEALGMKYVNIPMSGWKYPKQSQIDEFMKLMNDPATGTVYVHCKAGKHRTGITGAVYRFNNYGWDYDKAYQEMKNYNFSWWIVHGALKTFVKDYFEKMESQKEKNIAVQNAPALNASN